MPGRSCAFCGLRVNARAGICARDNKRKISLPTTPVPPVTRIMKTASYFLKGESCACLQQSRMPIITIDAQPGSHRQAYPETWALCQNTRARLKRKRRRPRASDFEDSRKHATLELQ